MQVHQIKSVSSYNKTPFKAFFEPNEHIIKNDNTDSTYNTATQILSKDNNYGMSYYANYNINFRGGTNSISRTLQSVFELIEKNPTIEEAMRLRPDYNETEAIITFLRGRKMIEKSPATVLNLILGKNYHDPSSYRYSFSDMQAILSHYEGKNEQLDYVLNKEVINRSAENVINILDPLIKAPEYIKQLVDKRRPDGCPWIMDIRKYEYVPIMLEIDEDKAKFLIEQPDINGDPRFYDYTHLIIVLKRYRDNFEKLVQLLQERTNDGRYKYDENDLVWKNR